MRLHRIEGIGRGLGRGRSELSEEPFLEIVELALLGEVPCVRASRPA